MSEIAIPEGPSMSVAETACLLRFLTPSQRYLEFGSGGSTVLAARIGVPRLYSVESDRLWAEAVSNTSLIKDRVEAGNYRIRRVDTGETKEWGFPAKDSEAIKWSDYSLSIWAELTYVPDFVLVDGRFRVSCALQSIARCADDTVIAIHDFERDHYQVILRHVEVVERVERLIVLRRKRGLNEYQFGIDCAEHLLKPW
jgi:hypothetical protein